MPPTEIAHAEPLDVTELGALAPFEPPNVVPGPEDATGNGRPRWARPALAFLLVATAASYLYNLTASGFGNSFYAAAVEAGSKSWKAMLFGSLDPSNFITVDKPPASLWVMDLSARLFGFSTWSVMAAQRARGCPRRGAPLRHRAPRQQRGGGPGCRARCSPSPRWPP